MEFSKLWKLVMACFLMMEKISFLGSHLKMASVSQFTAIPVDRACEHICNKHSKDDTLGQRSKLSIDDVIKLLHFTLSNSYFNYSNETYKQIHGCAMGSPVSPIVVNLCMEEIEELAFNQTDLPPTKWFRCVDDVFSIIKKHAITNFHNLLNSIDPLINFTIANKNKTDNFHS